MPQRDNIYLWLRVFLQNYHFFLKKICLLDETFVTNPRLPMKEKMRFIFTIKFHHVFFLKGVAMKKQHVSALLFAIIFAVMPMILAANPTNTPASDIQTLRKEIGYPQWAIKQQVEGTFEMFVYVNESGEVAMVNFDASSATPGLSALIAEVSQKIYAHKFSGDHAGQTLRIPFRFSLTK